MITGWFVFVNNINYGAAPEEITKGWPMKSCHSRCMCAGREYPKALAVNWGLALVVSVVGCVGARKVYRIAVSRLSRLNIQAEHAGASDSDKP